MNDKIKILTEVIYNESNNDEEVEKKCEQIYIEFAVFDTLNQLINHIAKILKFKIDKQERIELYITHYTSKIKLYDIKNFYFYLSNAILLKEILKIEIRSQKSKILSK